MELNFKKNKTLNLYQRWLVAFLRGFRGFKIFHINQKYLQHLEIVFQISHTFIDLINQKINDSKRFMCPDVLSRIEYGLVNMLIFFFLFLFFRFLIPNPKAFRFVRSISMTYLTFFSISFKVLAKRRRKIWTKFRAAVRIIRKPTCWHMLTHDAKTSEAKQHCYQTKNGIKAINNSIKHSNKCADGGDCRNSDWIQKLNDKDLYGSINISNQKMVHCILRRYGCEYVAVPKFQFDEHFFTSW